MTKDLDIDNLIKVAKSGDAASEKSDSNKLSEAEKFIIAFDLKPGKVKVTNEVLYRTYKNWALNPVSRLSFFRLFSHHFIPQRERKRRYYNLNKYSVELSYRLEVLTGYGK